jgi:hypothetical protein
MHPTHIRNSSKLRAEEWLAPRAARSLALGFVLTILAAFVLTPEAQGQLADPASEVPAAPTVNRQPFHILRFDDNWVFLQDSAKRTDVWDRVKYIPLSALKPAEYLSFGGEVRGAYESIQNDNFTQQPYATNAFGTQRFQLFLDGHINPHFRFFVQLESGEEEGRSGGARPIDLKRLDFLNAFIDLRPSTSSRFPTLRIGKQELNFGSGRFVSVREGPNVRQSFYAFRLDENIAKWTLSTFLARPAKDNPGFFDNVPQHTTQFWGGFATHPLTTKTPRYFDLYYFGLNRKNGTFDRGSGNELRHTVGGRVVSPAPLLNDVHPFIPHYDIEAAYQFGDFGGRPIRAWTVSGEFGYILHKLPFSPHVGARADISSGDGSNHQGALGTFNPLFPLGNYFGIISDTGPGPVNFRDIHPDLRFTLPKGVSLNTSWVFQWRQSLHDGVYTVPGSLMVPAGTSAARFVGHRPGAELRWQINLHAYVQADYGIFYSGRFLQDSGRSHNLNYRSLWVGYKF